ncbi:uncharacterized protein LOC141807998 [Halichoeres trimaculatus]|uniref:uncharacterized protein LOC141807998 n=1 Tax=Halichoeres trimaculatus TaxID=147232 RepID=UPI003D9F98BF
MKIFHRYSSINKTFSLIVYMYWLLLPTDGKTIIARVGSTVTLPCNETYIHSLTQLTWKINGNQILFILNPPSVTVFPAAANLSLSMSHSASQLYALIVENARESHTGNYTCETTALTGVWKQEWELLITAENPKDAGKLSLPTMVVIITVPCVTVLIFIITLTLILCRHRAKNCTCSQPEDGHEQTEDIYENCFDNRHYIRPPQSKPRPH